MSAVTNIRKIPPGTNREMLEKWLESGFNMNQSEWEIRGDYVYIYDSSQNNSDTRSYDLVWFQEFPDNVILFEIFDREEMLSNWFGITYDDSKFLASVLFEESLTDFIHNNKEEAIMIMNRNLGVSSIVNIKMSEYAYASNVVNIPATVISQCIMLTFSDYSEQVQIKLAWGDARTNNE